MSEERSAILTDFPGAWVLYWLLIPNLAFMIMWFVGGPPMIPVFALTSMAGIAAAQIPSVTLKRVILAGTIGYSIFYYICVSFNLDIEKASSLFPLLMEISPLRSPEYIISLVAFLVSASIALKKAPHVRRFSSPMSYLIAVLVTIGLLYADHFASADTRSTYSRLPPPGTSFASATGLTGIEVPGPDSRNLVIIIVESWGVPQGERVEAIFDADWKRPHWATRYDVSQGNVPFYGSTTSGELRELCGRYSTYSEVGTFTDDCLPSRYLKAGYQTTAYHGFSRSFFSRDEWYPKIGFGRSKFRDILESEGISECKGVFAGSCDREIPAAIAEQLKSSHSPQMIYFLTLNTHLPIMDDPKLGTADCQLGGTAWAQANPQLCRLFLLHHQLADEIDRMAMDQLLPPTDFLIVGDHFPAFFDRSNRKHFVPGVVPWVSLSYRADANGEELDERIGQSH